ncbi:MAG TPA: signal peptidase I [Gemmatimonadaceae bacterium]|nr:signal peptidase I [Gemmatimonadaceae bacterium]
MEGYEEKRKHALQLANRRQTGGAFSFLAHWAKIIIVSLALFIVIRSFGVEAFKIASGSMEHTLFEGDFLLINKLVYGAGIPGSGVHLPALHSPRRGDVIVFTYPVDPRLNYVKRIVGIPGDTLAMRDAELIRNGKPVRENYIQRTPSEPDQSDDDFRWQKAYLVGNAAVEDYHPSRNNWGPLVVPAHDYFVLGDNRDNSSDSRYWGFVADSLVRGQPLVVYYSYAPDTGDKLDWLTRLRWKRFGEIVH